MPEIPLSGQPTPDRGLDRKTKLNSLRQELKQTHEEWESLSNEIHQMLHSEELERARPELGERGWKARMARADLLIGKMTTLEAQMLALFEE